MNGLDKREAVELLLEKRFGTRDPEQINSIVEINIYESVDNEENPLGFGIELVLESDNGNISKEEYQVNDQGVIYSWGDAPVLDERSLNQAPELKE